MGEAGALIVAHENVRERMSTEQVLERIPEHGSVGVPTAVEVSQPLRAQQEVDRQGDPEARQDRPGTGRDAAQARAIPLRGRRR